MRDRRRRRRRRLSTSYKAAVAFALVAVCALLAFMLLVFFEFVYGFKLVTLIQGNECVSHHHHQQQHLHGDHASSSSSCDEAFLHMPMMDSNSSSEMTNSSLLQSEETSILIASGMPPPPPPPPPPTTTTTTTTTTLKPTLPNPVPPTIPPAMLSTSPPTFLSTTVTSTNTSNQSISTDNQSMNVTTSITTTHVKDNDQTISSTTFEQYLPKGSLLDKDKDLLSNKIERDNNDKNNNETNQQSISFTLPVLCRDVVQAHLVLSIFFHQVDPNAIDTVWIVPEANELDCIHQLVDTLILSQSNSSTASATDKLKVMSVEALLPDLTKSQRPRRNRYRTQMMTRLAIAQYIRTEYYVTLDANVIFTSPMTYDDFIVPSSVLLWDGENSTIDGTLSRSRRTGRAITNTQNRSTHLRWWNGATGVLKLKKKQLRKKDESMMVPIGSTPSVLHRNTSIQLMQYVSKLYDSQPWSVVLHDISFDMYWTEYTLYYLFAKKIQGTFDVYHDTSQNHHPQLYSSRRILTYEHFEGYNWTEAINSPKFYCVVMQQNKNWPLSRMKGPHNLASQLREYLPKGSVPDQHQLLSDYYDTKDVSRSLSFVMPMLCRDLTHAHLILSILFRQVDPDAIDEVWIIPDAADMDCIQQLVNVFSPNKDNDYSFGTDVRSPHPGLGKIKVITVEDLLPDLETNIQRSRNGYRIQMMTKLAIARHVRTEYYVTLDTDIVFTSQMTFDDFIRPNTDQDDHQARTTYSDDGTNQGTVAESLSLRRPRRAITNMMGRHTHEKWWNGALRTLKLESKTIKSKNKDGDDEVVMGVTPCVLHRNISMEVMDYVARLYDNQHWSVLLHDISYDSYWTEYTLYYTYAKQIKNIFEVYHDTSWDPKLYSSSSIWNMEQFERFNWTETINNPHHYSIVTQQNKIFNGLPGRSDGPDMLATRLRKYLPEGSVPSKLITYEGKKNKKKTGKRGSIPTIYQDDRQVRISSK